MVRILLALSALLFAQAASANEYGLKKLNCSASNGVQIQTLEVSDKTLQVETTWGLMKKRFEARLSSLGFGVESGILLTPEGGGSEYGIEMNLNPDAKSVQQKTGSLYLKMGQVKQWIANVNCKVQMTQSTEE